jgi:hypothetical protein
VRVVHRHVALAHGRLLQFALLRGHDFFVGRNQFGRTLEHRVFGGMGLDQTRIDVPLFSIHQARLDTLLHGA